MHYKTGALLVLVAGLSWSFQALAVRQVVHAGPWAVLYWRSLGLFPVLLTFLALRGGARTILPSMRAAGLAGLLGGTALVGAMGGAILAYQTTTIANAAFLFAASPLIAAVLASLLLKEAVATHTRIAIMIALVGIFLMVREGLAVGAWLGNLAALVSALGFATFTVTLRWRHLNDSLPSVVIGTLLTLLASSTFAALSNQALLVSGADVAWSFGMGAVLLASGLILYTLGSKSVPSAELALLSNIEIVLAPLWVWLFVGETASAGTLIGGAIVMTGITLNALGTAHKATQPLPASST